jgi:hypothetical protein
MHEVTSPERGQELPSIASQQRLTPPARQLANRDWMNVASALGGAAALAAVIYAVGGAVTWSRLRGAGVQADQAIGAVSQQTLLAVGARQLLFPAVLGVGIVAALIWLERRIGPASPAHDDAHASQDPSGSPSRPRRRSRLFGLRGSLRFPRLVRKALSASWVAAKPLLVALSTPVRWYFRYVPGILWLWLPILVFAKDPVGQLILFVNVTGASAIGQWAATQNLRQARVPLGLGLTALVVTTGVIQEWRNPKPLPRADVTPDRGTPYRASFIAVGGGDAYLVRNRTLTVVPTSQLESLTVSEPPRRKSAEGPSVFNRVF